MAINNKFVKSKLITARVMHLNDANTIRPFINLTDYPEIAKMTNGKIQAIAELQYELGLLNYLDYEFTR